MRRVLDSMSRARTLLPLPPSLSSLSPFLPEMAIFRPMGELEAHPRRRSPHCAPPTRPTPRRGKRQHDNQSANKRHTGGEAPVDKRRRGIKRQRLRIKRRGGRIKRTRGGGVNVTTSWQTRGKQEGTAPQMLVGLSRGQEVAAAARREASRQPAG